MISLTCGVPYRHMLKPLEISQICSRHTLKQSATNADTVPNALSTNPESCSFPVEQANFIRNLHLRTLAPLVVIIPFDTRHGPKRGHTFNSRETPWQYPFRSCEYSRKAPCLWCCLRASRCLKDWTHLLEHTRFFTRSCEKLDLLAHGQPRTHPGLIERKNHQEGEPVILPSPEHYIRAHSLSRHLVTA